jgi:hypothetical protein
MGIYFEVVVGSTELSDTVVVRDYEPRGGS